MDSNIFIHRWFLMRKNQPSTKMIMYSFYCYFLRKNILKLFEHFVARFFFKKDVGEHYEFLIQWIYKEFISNLIWRKYKTMVVQNVCLVGNNYSILVCSHPSSVGFCKIERERWEERGMSVNAIMGGSGINFKLEVHIVHNT